MNHLTNHRRSDGTPLDGRHGISGLCDGSSWRCITKRDGLSWFDHTRFRTTVRVSKQEQVMFESSSKSRKSRDGWQMIWQWVPDIWSNRWKWFGGCNGGFTWGNTYRQNWRRAKCSRRYILWDERCIGFRFATELVSKLLRLLSGYSNFSSQPIFHGVLVYRCLHGTAPPYLSEMLSAAADIAGRRSLRSATHGDFIVPRSRTVRFGSRTFAVSGPTFWNSLTNELKNSSLTEPAFKKQLKTFLFRTV